MDKQKKCGYMLRFKKRLFYREWCREYLVLFKDSRLLWYKEKDKAQPQGGVIVSESPGMIAIGMYTARVPNRPDIPPGFGLNQLIALGTKDRQKVYWFLTKSEEDASHWLAAICETLPTPPGYSDMRLKPETNDGKEERSCNTKEDKELMGAGATAFATGVLVGGALACALGWGNGLGWGLGGGFGCTYDETSIDILASSGDPGIHSQAHDCMMDSSGGYDCGGVGDASCDVDAGACDFGAIF